MIKYLPFLFFLTLNPMETTVGSTVKDDHSVVVNIDAPVGQPNTLARQESGDSISCSIKSKCLKDKKAIIFGAGSSIAFIVTLVIHLIKC